VKLVSIAAIVIESCIAQYDHDIIRSRLRHIAKVFYPGEISVSVACDEKHEFTFLFGL
jgi:hypothetical protein